MRKLRVGIIGPGQREYGLLQQVLLKMDGLCVTAVCDPYLDRTKKAAELVETAGYPRPYETDDYRTLADKSLIDCALVITSRKSHTEAVIYCMQKDVFGEIVHCSGGQTITLTLDTSLPRPYSRGLTVHGQSGESYKCAGMFH